MSSKVIAGLGAKHTPNSADYPIGRIMTKVASELCLKRKWVIHTGGDQGAGAFFEQGLLVDGCDGPDESLLKRFLPSAAYNGHQFGILIHDEDLLSKARKLLIEHQVYPSTPRFITLEGDDRKVLSEREVMLCDLHTRLVFQILGETLDQPVTMVVGWTPDGATERSHFKPEVTGSAGIGINLAQACGIPVFNLQREDHLKRICTFIGEPLPGSAT